MVVSVRLFRPHIPLEIRCRVLLRQIGEMWPDDCLAAARKAKSLSAYENGLKQMLADNLGCGTKDLRLDHDPPLGARRKKGEGKKTVYTPAANDPDHLFYRPHGAQFEGSHDIKTRVRGDHGQYSDIALIKRERRRQRKAKPTRKLVSRSTFPKGRKLQSRNNLRRKP